MQNTLDRFDRTPANFRVLRDMIGFKQDEFADIVGVDRSMVRRWDSGKEPVPDIAWRALESLAEDHFAAVANIVSRAGMLTSPDDPVQIPYYRSREDYVGEGDWMSADNAARAAAERLLELGYRVEFIYPKKAE